MSQKQDASGAENAIQSGRDTNISGITPEQMKEIVEAIANQVPIYTAIARDIVESRLSDFEKRILDKLSKPSEGKAEALKDPDFQFVLGQAQKSFSRSGDEQVRDVLIGLIGERSKQEGRTRLSLSLNDAVEKSSFLTKNEFAELTITFLLKYCQDHSVSNFDKFCLYISKSIVPFLKDISESETSYMYLEAQSCASVAPIGTAELHNIFLERYGGVLAKGFERQAALDHLPDGKKAEIDNPTLFSRCLLDSSKMQVGTVNRSTLEQVYRGTLTKEELDNVWALNASNMLTQQEVIDRISGRVPEIADLYRMWTDTPLKSLVLTSIGVAIGHANAVRLISFNAPLGIWIT